MLLSKLKQLYPDIKYYQYTGADYLTYDCYIISGILIELEYIPDLSEEEIDIIVDNIRDMLEE